jgi:hypothetical protein
VSITSHDKQGGAEAPAVQPVSPLKPKHTARNIIIVLLVAAAFAGALVGWVIIGAVRGFSMASSGLPLNQPTAQASESVIAPTPGGNQLPSPAPTGTVSFRHRPALSDYQGTAQWFEDALLKGLGQRDPRYFDLVFALHNAAYNETLATMSQYSSTYHPPKVAHISDFKLLDEAPGAHFVASYVVLYDNGTPQHEKITAVLQDGLWYLDYYEFSS